jgi:hypothetical protein
MAEFDFFERDIDTTFNSLETGKNRNVGLFKPNLKKIDPTSNKGYTARLRFLPNLTQDMKAGLDFIKKTLHYINPDKCPIIPQDLKGYYECGRDQHEDCGLCTTYWLLKKHTDPDMQRRVEGIDASTNYYAYVYVMENELEPSMVGKILVWKFPTTVKKMIEAAKDGELIEGQKADIFDLANGHDFKLKLTIKAGTAWPDYTGCKFYEASSPLKIDGVAVKTLEDDNGKVVLAKSEREKVKTFLLNRESNLEDHASRPYTDEEREKISRIVSVLTSKDSRIAESAISRASNPQIGSPVSSNLDKGTKTVASIFDDEDDE